MEDNAENEHPWADADINGLLRDSTARLFGGRNDASTFLNASVLESRTWLLTPMLLPQQTSAYRFGDVWITCKEQCSLS